MRAPLILLPTDQSSCSNSNTQLLKAKIIAKGDATSIEARTRGRPRNFNTPAVQGTIFDWSTTPGLSSPFGQRPISGQAFAMSKQKSIELGHTSKPTFDDEKRRYLHYYGDYDTRSGGGIEEMIRTTPIFSLSAKCQVDGVVSQPSSFGNGAVTSNPNTSSLDEDVEANKSTSNDAGRLTKPPAKLSLHTEKPNPVLPHYGLLGFDVKEPSAPEPILLNTNAPNSAFICGSQGSGKSYTLSCMLEACLLPNEKTGVQRDPIAGVVFHYDINAACTVAEVASLASRAIKVNVLVSRSAYAELKNAYEKEAGAENITVRPLLFDDKHLTVDRMNKLMAFTSAEGKVPLYMEVIQRLLRQTKINGDAFSFTEFKQQLKNEKFDNTQLNMLNMRMALLESFCSSVALQDFARDTQNLSDRKRRKKKHDQGLGVHGDPFSVKAGELTIIDLSDPFVEPTTACVLFYVCLGIINANRPKNGLIIALDEAHKYLDKATDAANMFTDQLLTTIREQRHNATRVIIATQEPTFSERLLDLSSMSIVHRFTSPAWFDAIKNHLGGASKMLAGADEHKEIFEQIVELQVGESLVFSPSSFVRLDDKGKPKKLGTGIMKMKTRKREGVDAGQSVLVSKR